MPLIITLHRTTPERAEVFLDEHMAGTCEPAALLADHPLSPTYLHPAEPVAYGQRLFAALGGEKLRALLADLPQAPYLDSMLTLRFDDPELAAVPWEYLHDGKDFLIFHYLLVREIPDTLLPAPIDTAQTWRLLAIASDVLLEETHDPAQGHVTGTVRMPRRQVEQELDALRLLLQKQPTAPLQCHRTAPTYDALPTALAGDEPVLLHFSGYGDMRDAEAVLCFDDGTGCLDPRPAADMAGRLGGQVRFAFLNTCRTATSREPAAHLALALVRGGVPAVLSTHYHALDDDARIFVHSFYHHMPTVKHPAQALYRARLELRSALRRAPHMWAVPVLTLAADYAWQAPTPISNGPLPPVEPPLPRTADLLAPRHIVGREQELVDVARRFVHEWQRIVTIRGAGGIGKTALVNALAFRLRFAFRDGIYALALTLPGDTPLRADTVRYTLAEHLGLSKHPAFQHPNSIDQQESALIEAVHQRPRLLLIFDAYEVVRWRLGSSQGDAEAPQQFAPAQHDEARAVQQLVERLAEAGAYLLITARQSPAGLTGENLYPAAEAVRGHQLGGLARESSVALLQQHIGQRDTTEGFLSQLAGAVQHHPLALQLAAARWADSELEEQPFLQHLWDELRKAAGRGLSPRQRAVQVNVRLSLNDLPVGLRESLLLLTIIANPRITPEHGAVIWGLEGDTEQAHMRLERLRQSALLHGHAYDETLARAIYYSMHPVIAAIASALARQELDLEPAYMRYAQWADERIVRAYGADGVSYNAAMARDTQALLPDFAAALRWLPPQRRGWAAWMAAWVFYQYRQPHSMQEMWEMAEEVMHEQEDQELRRRLAQPPRRPPPVSTQAAPISMREAVSAWVGGGRSDDEFLALLTTICGLYAQIAATGSAEQREHLAGELAYMRAVRPLPPGANDFLHMLQLLLRNEPGMAEHAARIRARLPASYRELLDMAVPGTP